VTRALVCGSRGWTDAALLEATLDALAPDEVIEGCANGADSLAEAWALKHRVFLNHVPADWDTYGRSAGPIRNAIMLQLKPDVVVAFDLGTRGTADMMGRADKAGVPVTRVVPK
jgi:hypothetical protein